MSLGKWARLSVLIGFVAHMAWAQDPKPVRYPDDLGFAPERLDRITKTFQGFVDDDRLPGAVVLIARGDKVAYFRAFGFRDREQKLPMTTDDIFRLGSMTKPIVSVAAMTLVEEGRLDLSAPVSRYLPEFATLQVGVEQTNQATGKRGMTVEPRLTAMTVQDLMRHTSGLVQVAPIGDGLVSTLYRDFNLANRDETLDQLVSKLSMLPLAHQPGAVWDDSMATDVLGRVLEVASGMPLDRFVEESVTKPLGMASTGFSVRDTDRERVAQPRADPASGQRPDLFDPTVKPKRLSGGGGMVSTAGDYLRFCEMLLDGGRLGNARILAPSTVALMTANALPPGVRFGGSVAGLGDTAPTPAMGQGFGLGFGVRIETGRNPVPGSVNSFYWTGAYSTIFVVDPREKLILLLMTQVPFGAAPPYWNAIRYLTYQAIVGAE